MKKKNAVRTGKKIQRIQITKKTQSNYLMIKKDNQRKNPIKFLFINFNTKKKLLTNNHIKMTRDFLCF